MIRQIIDRNMEVKPNSKKLEALREYFAGCFTADGAFDIERFKDMMKDEVDISNEGYSLDFLGKDYANLIASIDTTTVIEPDIEHNEKPENSDSENIYISGDNLDALKHLLKSYAGKVKCIYIDPPYNTGSDGFVYNDKFCFTPEELEKKLSIDEDEAKRILDLTSRGSSTHSAWLMFMSPCLQLARELLGYFTDETGRGKLYINYPMVESLRYTKELPDNNYWQYTVTRQRCQEEKFKHQVHEFSFYKSNLEYLVLTIKPADDDTKIQQKANTAKTNWLHLVTMNTSKANYICHDKNELPDEVNNQQDIFDSQLSKYINTEECKVAILNAFPIFLFDYFGKKIFYNMGGK